MVAVLGAHSFMVEDKRSPQCNAFTLFKSQEERTCRRNTSIASFLEIVIDETKWDVILLNHCSFEYMKANAAMSAPFGGSIFEGGQKHS